MKSFTVPLILYLLLSCTSYTAMNRTSYRAEGFLPKGNIYVAHANKAQTESLEFNHFKPLIEQQLAMSGFTPVHSLKKATYVAIIGYGIDTGTTRVVSTPVYGYDAFNRYGVIIHGYPMPSYAMMGVNTVEYQEYTHILSMEIVDAKSVKSKSLKQLYTSKVVSKNDCPSIAATLPDLIEGLFSNFPAMNAETTYVRVPTSGNCEAEWR